MPDSNGNRTIHEWMMHIDSKIDTKTDDILAKLDTKADTADLNRVEERTHNMAVKQGTISGGMAVIVVSIKHFLGIGDA